MIDRSTNIQSALRRRQRGLLLNPFRFGGGGGGGDPSFADVLLLMHMDGTNGSTTFTDSSSFARSVTRTAGSVTISTAQSKFGGASGSFGAGTDQLTVPNSTDFNFGTNNFTIEFFVRPAAGSLASGRLWLRRRADVNTFWAIEHNSTGGIAFSARNAGTFISNIVSASSILAEDVWQHVAIVRNGTAFNLYLDGTSRASNTSAGSFPAPAVGISIGAGLGGGLGQQGFMDELRITRNVARYTANFTPPSAAFPDS